MLPRLAAKNYPGMELIRPLYFTREAAVQEWVEYCRLHFLPCACPAAQREQDTKRAEIKALSEQLAAARLEIVQTATAVCGFTKDASFDALRTFAEQHSADGKLCAMFSDAGDGTMSYFLFVPEGGDIRDTVKAMNAAFAGKGGGKPHYAQGKLTATKEELAAFFEN